MFMGLLVFIVDWIGWNATGRLSDHIDTIGRNNLPSVEGIWRINEGQTQVESSERGLLNPKLNQVERQAELERINTAWNQIEAGFKQYEQTPRTPEEDRRYKQMLQDWDKWKQAHQEFLRIEREYVSLGVLNPFEVQLQLISQGKNNSPEIATARAASNLFNKLTQQAKTNRPIFETATKSILKVVDANVEQSTATLKAADGDISQSKFWGGVGMTIGPLTAIILGIFLSIAIAKPIDKALKGIINMIVSSSAEISATVEQQEQIITQQATSVNETTATMDELGSSSRQAAEQAESAVQNANGVLNLAQEGANGARQVLNLAEDGTKVVEKTLEGMSDLREKVGAIAEQIMRLSQQTNQISSITAAVTDLANQTNKMAINASVEAERAGEHGKGLGVVAGEIRRLADQSKKSADKINNILADIQNAISSTVMVTDEGTKTVKEGIKLSSETAQAFNGVAQSINDIVLKNQEMTLTAISDSVLKNQEMTLDAVNHIVIKNQQIALSAKQQALAVQQVIEAMNNINIGARQTASGITQTKVSTQQLNDAAKNLKTLSPN